MKKVILLLTFVTLFTFSSYGSVFATVEPVTTEPVTTEPVTTEPATTEPVTTEPVTTEPVTTEPATTEPATTEPVTTEPATTEPVTTEPVTTEPATTEPATTEPATTEPVTHINNTYIKNIKCVKNNITIDKLYINFGNSYKYETTNNFNSEYFNGKKVIKVEKNNINANIDLVGKFGKGQCKPKKFILKKGYNKIKHEVLIKNKKCIVDLLIYSHTDNATFNINTNTYNIKNYKNISKVSSSSSSNSSNSSSSSSSSSSSTVKKEDFKTITTNLSTEGILTSNQASKNASDNEYNVSKVVATSLPKTGEDLPVLPFVIGSIIVLGGVSLILKKALIN